MPDAPLKFADLVKQELILPDLDAGDRTDALRQMAQMLVDAGYGEPTFVDAILDREANHPSALPMPGHKIAIPHADATHVRRSAILFARLCRPVAFQSMGDPGQTLQVRLISMFALKEKHLIGDLLETLITVYQDNQVLDAILSAPDGASIYTLLRENVNKQCS
jgi:PTS system galactitol-specific IIA component